MQSLSILIIEDENLVAADIRRTMEKAGHSVVACARSFKDAIEAAKIHSPDIAILDIQLAGSQDGIAVATEILSNQQLPFVVLTGSTENETYLRARNSFTPAAYLTNPFRPVDLVRIVELSWQNFSVQQAEGDYSPQNHVFLPVEKGFEKVVKSEVAYIATQKSAHAVYIHEVYKKTPRLVQLPMVQIETYFNAPDFYRLSRSLIVNLNYIERIEGVQLYLQNTASPIAIPENARTDLMRKLAIGKRTRK